MGQPEVRLRLNPESAELLADVIYAVGEQIAAGAPPPTLTSDDCDRLNRIMRSLYGQIGQNRSYGRRPPDPDELL